MPQPSWNSFEEYVKKKMDEEYIAGVAVAVALNGEVMYQKGFGYRDLKKSLPVTPDTIMGIASVTKSFTALAVMKLEEEGLLSVQDSVVKHLPEFKLFGIEDMESIKIYHLLSHITGLAPMTRREELNTLDEHLVYLADQEYEILGKPGEYFSYCNDTFLLLGAIIERLTGKLWRRHITETILNPLQMYRSTTSIEEVEKYNNVTVPYVWNKQISQLEEQHWPKLGNYEVGGGVRSTALDLLKYGDVYVNVGKSRGRKIISVKYIRKMWQPVYQVDRHSYYGYGLKVTPDYAGMTLVEHGGGQPGVSSNFGFVPEKGLVVSVLCNVSNVSAGEIWLAAVNTALGLPIEQQRSTEPHYEPILEELERMTGTYDSAEGGYARIFLEETTPMLETDGEVFTLRASSNQTLVILKNERPVRFYFKESENRESGKAWAILLGSRMLTRRNHTRL